MPGDGDSPLRVLVVDDSELDAELMVRELRRRGLSVECARVQTREQLGAALERGGWHIVLSDHAMPQLSSEGVLELVAEHAPELPCVVVSGAIGEESAASVLRRGAADYVLKDNLARLVPAVQRALRERRTELELERLARQRQLILESTADGVLGLDRSGRITFANPAAAEMLGYEPRELLGRPSGELLALTGPDSEDSSLLELSAGPAGQRYERTLRRRDDGELPVEMVVSALPEQEGGAVVSFADVSSRLEAERARQEAAREKDEFFALISHELKTPLTAMTGYLELLREHEGLDGRAATYVGVLERNSERLRRLVGDLLVAARMQAGDFRLAQRELDLAALAEEAIAAARPRADEQQVQLQLRLAAAPIATTGDPGRLAQVLDNLLANAIKFSQPGGRVVLAVEAEAGECELRVADTGVGIEAAEHARVFERFARAKRAREGVVPGSGLGLSIVKTIIEAHGGSVALRSQPGQGTEVRCRLPRREAPRDNGGRPYE